MTCKQFVELVTEMRATQKGYFATRSKDALTNSKRLEKLVDNAITDGMWLPTEQDLTIDDKEWELFSDIGI